MTWLLLAVAFLAFMAFIGTVQAVDRRAAVRYGYRPFALPNLAFMLVPHGLLAAWLSGYLGAGGAEIGPALPAPVVWGLAALGVTMVSGLFLILRRRTNAWLGLFGVCAMTLGASVLLFSVLFAELAGAGSAPTDRP